MCKLWFSAPVFEIPEVFLILRGTVYQFVRYGRLFHVRFQEHFRDFKYGNGKSKFAQQLLENRHTIAPMEVLHIKKKGKIMNTLERFHIYNETKLDNQINDNSMVK